MSTQVIARRYARALFDLARDGVDIEPGLARLAEAAAHDEVRPYLADPELPLDAKAGLLIKLAASSGKELERFVGLLCERGKAVLLPEIHALFDQMQREAADQVTAEVVVATELDAKKKKALTESLGKMLDKKVSVTVHQDKDIIGGMVVRIGDRQIDHSVRSRLENLRRQIAA
ncbi:MAG TPA: F0F1 ATP synthase subunit delta [Mariprofundaceae bacterium]|nr:F0F1 ATP synthase subunit delta [Mariprofundaceae bacterium]